MNSPGRRALFPISLSNHQYSTNRIISALERILGDYEDITFLVADKLHLYNTAFRAFLISKKSLSPNPNFSLFGTERSLSGILEERKNWLDKIKMHFGPKADSIRWRVLGVEDISDGIAFAIQRRVNILALVDQRLREDILTAATSYASKKGFPEPTASAISERYIIEEMALSVRIKVVEGIYDEFYMGTQLQAVVKLYRNEYQASPWELAGIPERSSVKFRFFDSVTDTGAWNEIVG
jgi:hypothetical protein